MNLTLYLYRLLFHRIRRKRVSNRIEQNSSAYVFALNLKAVSVIQYTFPYHMVTSEPLLNFTETIVFHFNTYVIPISLRFFFDSTRAYKILTITSGTCFCRTIGYIPIITFYRFHIPAQPNPYHSARDQFNLGLCPGSESVQGYNAFCVIHLRDLRAVRACFRV